MDSPPSRPLYGYTPSKNRVPYDGPSFPPGLEPLQSATELVVSNRLSKYKIKDTSKELVFTAKAKEDGPCCTCDQTEKFCDVTLKTKDERPIYDFRITTDAFVCCSFRHESFILTFPPDVTVGRVVRTQFYVYEVLNPGDDVLYTVTGGSGFRPYKITTEDGGVVGTIDSSHSIKNKLKMPANLDIRKKALLLSTAIFIQRVEHHQRMDN